MFLHNFKDIILRQDSWLQPEFLCCLVLSRSVWKNLHSFQVNSCTFQKYHHPNHVLGTMSKSGFGGCRLSSLIGLSTPDFWNKVKNLCFSCLKNEFSIFPFRSIAFCSITGHREESQISCSLRFLIRYFCQWTRYPWAFYSLSKQSHLSQPLLIWEMLFSLCGASLNQYVHVSVFWGDDNWTHHSRCGLNRTWQRRKFTSLKLLAAYQDACLLMHPRILSLQQGHIAGPYLNFCRSETPPPLQSCFPKAAFFLEWVAPAPYAGAWVCSSPGAGFSICLPSGWFNKGTQTCHFNNSLQTTSKTNKKPKFLFFFKFSAYGN